MVFSILRREKKEEKKKPKILFVINDNLRKETIAYIIDASTVTTKDIQEMIDFLETRFSPDLAKYAKQREKWSYRFDSSGKIVVVYRPDKISLI